MTKDTTEHYALQRAVTSYCERNHKNRRYFAEIIGLNGPNNDKQLSAYLNPHNEEKILNKERIEALKHAFDKESIRVYWDEMLHPWDLSTCSIKAADEIVAISLETHLSKLLDNAILLSTDVFREGKTALEDDVLSKSELITLEIQSEKLEKKGRELKELLRARRENEFGGV